jgi:hypothetical protein
MTIINLSTPTSFYDWKMVLITSDGIRHKGRYRKSGKDSAMCLLDANGTYLRCGPEKAVDVITSKVITTAQPVDAVAEFEFPDIPPAMVNNEWSKKCHVELAATVAIDGLLAISNTLLSEINKRGPQVLHGCESIHPPCLR